MIKVTIVCGHLGGMGPGVQWIQAHNITSVRAYISAPIPDLSLPRYKDLSEEERKDFATNHARWARIKSTIYYAANGQHWGSIDVEETPEQLAAMIEHSTRPVQLPPATPHAVGHLSAEFVGLLADLSSKYANGYAGLMDDMMKLLERQK